MPFIKEIIAKKNIRILIWKIDETYTDLKALIQLTDDQERELERRKQISYKKQFLASRKLIKMAELNELNSFFTNLYLSKKMFTFQFLTQFIML